MPAPLPAPRPGAEFVMGGRTVACAACVCWFTGRDLVEVIDSPFTPYEPTMPGLEGYFEPLDTREECVRFGAVGRLRLCVGAAACHFQSNPVAVYEMLNVGGRIRYGFTSDPRRLAQVFGVLRVEDVAGSLRRRAIHPPALPVLGVDLAGPGGDWTALQTWLAAGLALPPHLVNPPGWANYVSSWGTPMPSREPAPPAEEPTTPDALRKLCGAPGDGAAEVRFTAEGGIREG